LCGKSVTGGISCRPSMGGGEEEWVQNGRGQQLYTRSFVPAGEGAVSRVVVFNHGLGDHSGHYLEFFEMLAASGCAVYTYDMQGHGRSDGSRANCNAWSELVEDCRLIIDRARKVQGLPVGEEEEEGVGASGRGVERVPFFLAGHSMGALLSATMALSTPRHYWANGGGVCLTSPAFDIPMNPILRVQKFFGPLISALLPEAAIVSAVRLEEMTHDVAAIENMRSDPLNWIGPSKTRIIWEIKKATDWVLDRLCGWDIPVLAIHGTEDRCTLPTGSTNFIEQVATAPSEKRSVLVEGAFHALYEEIRPIRRGVQRILHDFITAGPAAVHKDTHAKVRFH